MLELGVVVIVSVYYNHCRLIVGEAAEFHAIATFVI